MSGTFRASVDRRALIDAAMQAADDNKKLAAEAREKVIDRFHKNHTKGMWWWKRPITRAEAEKLYENGHWSAQWDEDKYLRWMNRCLEIETMARMSKLSLIRIGESEISYLREHLGITGDD